MDFGYIAEVTGVHGAILRCLPGTRTEPDLVRYEPVVWETTAGLTSTIDVCDVITVLPETVKGNMQAGIPRRDGGTIYFP